MTNDHGQAMECFVLLGQLFDMGHFWKENFEEFCDSTSLHAWNRLPKSPRPIRLIYWIIVICGSILLGSYFVYENVSQFLQAFATTTIDTSTGSLDEGAFPKIVICNSYKVRQSFLDTIFDKSVVTDDDSGYDAHELQEAFVKYFIKGHKEDEAAALEDKIKVVLEKYIQNEIFNETLVRECPADGDCYFQNVLDDRSALRETAMQSFSSMILQYKIQDKVYYGGSVDWNADHSSTDIGNCFGIQQNYIGSSIYDDYDPKPIDEEDKPKLLSGAPYGVDVLLDAETFDNGDLEEPFNGFTVAVPSGDMSLTGLNGFALLQ